MRILVIFGLCFYVFSSCTRVLFVKEDLVLKRKEGLVVFLDARNEYYENRDKGDVFVDSVFSQIFIPCRLGREIVDSAKIKTLLFSTKKWEGSIVTFAHDCNQIVKESSVKFDCFKIDLDEPVEFNICKKQIYIMPVRIDYIKTETSPSVVVWTPSISLRYKGQATSVNFDTKGLDVIRVFVLEHSW